MVLAALGLHSTPAAAACSGSSPTWTTTPDLASLQACVSDASPGDTVEVLAGDEIWDATLDVTGGVSLVGDGIGNTIIRAAGGTSLISYRPIDYAAETPFRVSGFTLDLGGARRRDVQQMA